MKRKGWYGMLVSGVVLISSSAILVTLSGVPPTVSAFYRNFFAALIWFLLFIICRPLPCCRWRLAPPKDEGGAFPLYRDLLLLGLLFAIDLWSWHRAILYLGAGPATLLGNLQVLFVALLAMLLFGERLRAYFFPGTLLALAGIALLTLGGAGDKSAVPAGLFFGLSTALTYSLFLVLLKKIETLGPSPQQILFWVSLLTAILLLPALLIEGQSLWPPGPAPLGWLVLHALISSVFGWWLIIKALKHLPVSASSTILLMQPLLTSIWGQLFLGQFLTPIQYGGIFLAVVGIRLANW